MKKIILVFFIAISSINAYAEEIFLAISADNSEAWYGYTESFTKIKDAYSVMVAKRFINSNRPDERFYVAVSFVDCKRGFGSLHGRSNPNANWEVISQVSIETGRTIGDIIAANICGAGKIVEQNQKNKPKNASSKSV